MSADVSEAMRPFLAAVWADRRPVVERVARAVISGFPTYAATPASEVWVGMTRIMERIVDGDPFRPATEADREAAYGTGAQGGRAGIGVDDLVGAVLLGAREVEGELLGRAEAAGVGAEVRLEASRRARAWAEQVAVWAARGLRETVGSSHSPGRREAALVAAVLEGADAVERALAAGIDIDGLWCAAVTAPAADAGESGEVELAALRFRHGAGSGVWATEGGVTRGILRTAPKAVGSLVVGVSAPVPFTDLRAAFAAAERSRRVAARFGLVGVHALEDLGLLVALHEDRWLSAALVRRWVEPLRSEPRHDLVRTARAYLDHQAGVDAVARELVVHPNTVRNRLARIERLLGPGWRQPRAQAEVWAALMCEGTGESA